MGVVIAIALYVIYGVILVATGYAVYRMWPESDIDFRIGKTLEDKHHLWSKRKN